MRGRFPPLLFGAIALLLLGACETAAQVAIELDETGAGHVAVHVELDDAAAARVGDLGGLVAAADLEAAGWRVVVAERRVLAEKKVQSAVEVNRAFEELGPAFAGLRFDRRQSFARTEVEVSGSVDLSSGIAVFGDEDLKKITGSLTGVDLPPEALALSLTVDLPGDEKTNATGPGTRWDLPMGAVTPIDAESTDVNFVGLIGVGVAVLCGLLLVVVLVRSVRP